MDREGHEVTEATLQEEDEYCAVCHTVYAAEDGCWCFEPDSGRRDEMRRGQPEDGHELWRGIS